MVERIFLYVEDSKTTTPAAELALSLAQQLGARVFAAHIINTAGLPTGPKRHDRLSELEELAWQVLYEIEDDAFEHDIRVSLLLDQGNPLDLLFELVRSYDAQLLVVAARSRLDPAELVRHSPVPVVFATIPRSKDDQDNRNPEA